MALSRAQTSTKGQMPYLATLAKLKLNSCRHPVSQIRSYGFFPWSMPDLSTKFHENRASNVCVILLNEQTNQPTNKQTDLGENNLLGGGE